jgi:hypothetical protein
MYTLIGKTVVKLAARYVKLRYKRPAQVALGLSVAAVAVAAYLASREVPEG